MTNTNFKKLISLTVVLLIILNVSFCVPASAENAIDLSKKGSITLVLKDKESGAPVRGKRFSLYTVATARSKGETIAYTYVAEFLGSGISLSDRNADNLANHLAYFAESRSLPHLEKYTDSEGRVSFTDLETGLYLVVPENVNSNPFLVSVPENLGGEWKYDIDATPKVEGELDEEGRDDITVEKKWIGEGHPGSVTVVLLRNGEEYDEEILSDENGWILTWENLSESYVWTVIEKNVPAGYEVQYETYSSKTVITNMKPSGDETTTSPEDTTSPDSTTLPDDTTLPNDTTSPDSTTLPDGTTSPGGTTKPQGTTVPTTKGETTTKEELADTGQLNWPVPVLAALGLILFSTGWGMLNLKKEEEQV